jgi:hypothetical protein
MNLLTVHDESELASIVEDEELGQSQLNGLLLTNSRLWVMTLRIAHSLRDLHEILVRKNGNFIREVSS